MNFHFRVRDLPREKLIFLIYAILLIIGAATHEMWTDETRPWVMASDLTVAELFGFLKNEFHPPGWYLVVKALSSVGFPALSMKVVSVIFSLLSFRLLLKASPFSLLQKCLFAGNAYLLYQYGVMARPYSLEILILFSICSIYHERQERRTEWFILIAVLASSHAFGLMLAPFFLFRNVLDLFQNSLRRKEIFIGAVVTLISIISIVLFMDPSESNLGGILRSSQVFGQRFFQAVSFTFQSVFLILPFGDNWWGRSLFSWTILPAWPAAILTLPAFYFLYRLSRKDRFAFFLTLYSWSILTFILVFYVFAGFNLNHIGQMFIVLVCCLWILRQSGGMIFTGILLLQFVSGMIMWNSDVRKPYTNGPQVAAALTKKNAVNIVADVPYFSSSWIIGTRFQITFPDGSLRRVAFGDDSIMTDMRIENYVLLPFTGLFLRSSTTWLEKNLKVASCGKEGETFLVTNYPVDRNERLALCLSDEEQFEKPLNPMENYRILSFRKDLINCNVKCP